MGDPAVRHGKNWPRWTPGRAVGAILGVLGSWAIGGLLVLRPLLGAVACWCSVQGDAADYLWLGIAFVTLALPPLVIGRLRRDPKWLVAGIPALLVLYVIYRSSRFDAASGY
jgi:hypothetical protein